MFDARASDEARVHAANLFSQALTRLAHKHTGGCFMVWKHALWLEDQQKHAARYWNKRSDGWCEGQWLALFVVATRRGERDGGSAREAPRVAQPYSVHATLGARISGWIICMVGTRDARRESVRRFQALGDATLHAGPRADGPEILDRSILIVAEAHDGR